MSKKMVYIKTFFSKNLFCDVTCIKLGGKANWYKCIKKPVEKGRESIIPNIDTFVEDELQIKELELESENMEFEVFTEKSILDLISKNNKLSKTEIIFLTNLMSNIEVTVDRDEFIERFGNEFEIGEGGVLTRDILNNLVKKKWSTPDPVCNHHSSGNNSGGGHSSCV